MSEIQNNFNVLSSVLETFEKVLTPCFGPFPLNSMLCTSTGKLIITSQGSTILGSMNVSHPLGRTIISAIGAHEKHTGDNSKTYLFLLSRILSQLTNSDAMDIVQFLMALPKVRYTLLNTIFRSIYSSVHATANAIPTERIVASLVGTLLRGKLSKDDMVHIVNLVVSALSNGNSVSIAVHVRRILDRLPAIVIECPSNLISQSRLITGFIIQRDFVYLCPNLCEKTSVRLVIYQPQSTEMDTKMEVKSQKHLQDFLHRKIQLSKLFVDSLAKNKIDILLTEEKLDDTIVELCRQRCISVIHYVSEEDIENIIFNTGINIVSGCKDIDQPNSIVEIHACSRILIAGHRSVHFSGPFQLYPKLNDSVIASHRSQEGMEQTEPEAVTSPPFHILVCSPSPGMCQQVTHMIGNCFRMLLSWLEPPIGYDDRAHNECTGSVGYHITGGCMFEYMMYEEIDRLLLSDATLDTNTRMALGMIQTAFRDICTLLINNAYPLSSKPKNFAEFRKQMSKCSRESKDDKLHDGKCSTGTCQNVQKLDEELATKLVTEDEITNESVSNPQGLTHIVMHPISSKVLMVLSVLDVLQQGLRVDRIVSVRKLPADSHCSDEEEDD